MPTFFHVTSRENAQAILEEGFEGDHGDVGFGVYLWGTRSSAERYAGSGGWDGSLSEPVIIEVEDHSIRKVVPHPTWDQTVYQDVYWRAMDDSDDSRWVPDTMRCDGLPPTTPAPSR